MRSRAALVALVAFVELVACSGGGTTREPAQPVPAQPADTCAHVADHLLTLLSPTAQEAPTDELDRVRASFSKHCTTDVWSEKARRCFLALKVKEEVDTCAVLLTPEQRAALEQPDPASRSAP